MIKKFKKVKDDHEAQKRAKTDAIRKARAARFQWKDGDLDHDPKEELDEEKSPAGHSYANPVHSEHKKGYTHNLLPDEKHKALVGAAKYAADHKKFLSNDDTADHIDNYKTDPSINNYLRAKKGTGIHPDHKEHVEHMDKVTSNKTHAEHNFLRGVSPEYGHNLFKNHKVGQTFKDHGYTSMTHDPEIAHEFTSPENHDEKTIDKNGIHHSHHHVIKVHVPKGSKGHYFDNKNANHDNDQESEFVLHRGSTFKVTKHEHKVFKPTDEHSWEYKDHQLQRHVHIMHVTVHKQRK